MPLSLIVKQKCPICGAVAVEKSSFKLGEKKLVTLECNHIIFEEVIKSADYNSIISSDGRKLMPYQVEGIKFLEAANGRALLADEQGLGKTVQAAALISLHREELFPAIIATKTTLKLQWMWEMFRWVGTKKVQVINSSKEIAVPGFDIYIITYDILKDEKMFSFVEAKSLILDECQAIKNHLSGRAKAVQKIVDKLKLEHIIGLSGTPIKNNAGEYFTILNLLRPRQFREFNSYIRNYCDSYETQYGWKVGGLANADRFHEETKDFVLRRTKSEVLPDLPELSRRFHHVELNPKFNAVYAASLRELEDLFYKDEDEETTTAMIAIMTKMRKITGLSKVTECVEFVADHVVSTQRKIVVFVHHHSVRDLLQIKLNEYLEPIGYDKVMTLSADQSAELRAKHVKDFETNTCKVMIASTLAAGEGLNLQFVSDAVMLERQWNPANEEQAEARFHRFGQKNPVTVTYMLASETIDEYFSELVEQKRAIVASTLDNKEISWESNNLMRELASVLVAKGVKKWSL